MKTHWLKFLGFFLLDFLIISSLSFADSENICVDYDDTNELILKVVLNKMEYVKEDRETENLTVDQGDDVEDLLEVKFEELFPIEEERPIVLFCPNRVPDSQGRFFSKFIDDLNDGNVLIEVWGKFSANKIDEGDTLKAQVRMMIIPVRKYKSKSSKLGFHVLRYPKVKKEKIQMVMEDIVFGDEFDVYVNIGNGLKQLKRKSYDSAINYFSNAIIKLKAMSDDSMKDVKVKPEDILKYVRELREQAIEENPDGKVEPLNDHLQSEGNS